MMGARKDHSWNVVIVGGGFAGVSAARELAKNSRCTVTLVSDKDSLVYYPLLYATATGSSRKISSIALSKIFENIDVTVVKDTVVGIDSSRKLIVGKERQYQYDTAIFALGVVTNYFGIKGLKERSWSIKSPDGIKAFRQHLHNELVTTKHFDKHYVVVGAGPTGVELAASLKDYLLRIGTWHGLKQHRVNVTLIEAASRVLPKMSIQSSRAALKQLQTLGVHVLLGTTVRRLDDATLVAGKRTIPTETVVWTSGVSNTPFYKRNSDVFRLNERGIVVVNEYLEASPNVFVIGDNAATKYAGLAQTAISEGKYVARVIKARLAKKTPRVYMPRLPFSVVPVGHRWAVLERGSLRLSGLFAAGIRRLADFVGYHDVLSFRSALNLWLSEREVEEYTCELCQKNNDSSRVA